MSIVEKARVASFAFLRLHLRLPAGGNIDDRNAALLGGCGCHGLDLCVERALSIFLERHFARLFVPARKHLPEEGSEGAIGLPHDERPETPADQPGALDS